MIEKIVVPIREYCEYLEKRLKVMRFRQKYRDKKPEPAKKLGKHLYCFRPMLLSESGHFFNNSLALVNLVKRKGGEISFFSQEQTAPSIREILPTMPVLPSYISKKEWPAEWKSYFWEYYLHKYVTPAVRSGDLVYFAETTFGCASAVIKWMQSLPINRRPRVILEFLSYYFQWRAASQTFLQEKGLFFSRHSSSEQRIKQAIICCTEVEFWAEKLSSEFGLPFLCLPTTKYYDDFPSLGEKLVELERPQKTIRVGLLGCMRKEKGDNLVKDIIQKCPSEYNVEFYIQAELESDEHVNRFFIDQPTVRILSKRLSRETYVKTMTKTDIVLLPYRPEAYAYRSSGIFCEAAANGIPTIVPDGTWMARMIETNQASGLIFSPYSAEAVLEGLKQCIDELVFFRKQAYNLAGTWRYKWSAEYFFARAEEEFMKRTEFADRRN